MTVEFAYIMENIETIGELRKLDEDYKKFKEKDQKGVNK